jgi:hypothetical protein
VACSPPIMLSCKAQFTPVHHYSPQAQARCQNYPCWVGMGAEGRNDPNSICTCE